MTTIRQLLPLVFLFPACTTAVDDEEADAEDIGIGGKGDGAAFTLGHYRSAVTLDRARSQVPSMVFLPKDANTPDGDSGSVDLALFDGVDYTYTKGSYRVYRSHDRDRLRVSDDRGEVVMRTDWEYSGDDLVVTGYQLHWLPFDPNVLGCLALEIPSGLFGDTFDVNADPDVRIYERDGSLEAWFGATSFSARTGDSVTIDDRSAKIVAQNHAEYTMRVDAKAPHRGELSSPEGTIAKVICR